VSHLREYVEVGDIARHILRMADLVRGAASGAPFSLAPLGEDGTFPAGGCPTPGPKDKGPQAKGCKDKGCKAGGCASARPGEPEEPERGWWVLAQGGPLDEHDFQAREAAREALLERVRRAGVLVGENVWVWDLSGRAQLVLTTLPTLERARKVAQRLRQKGLAIVIRREMP
jgi:hypothetical protein